MLNHELDEVATEEEAGAAREPNPLADADLAAVELPRGGSGCRRMSRGWEGRRSCCSSSGIRGRTAAARARTRDRRSSSARHVRGRPEPEPQASVHEVPTTTRRSRRASRFREPWPRPRSARSRASALGMARRGLPERGREPSRAISAHHKVAVSDPGGVLQALPQNRSYGG